MQLRTTTGSDTSATTEKYESEESSNRGRSLFFFSFDNLGTLLPSCSRAIRSISKQSESAFGLLRTQSDAIFGVCKSSFSEMSDKVADCNAPLPRAALCVRGGARKHSRVIILGSKWYAILKRTRTNAIPFGHVPH